MKPILTKAMIAVTSVALLGSCTTDPYTGESSMSRAGMGSIMGALAGAGIGALSGDDSRESRKRALIGGGLGALTGAAIGDYMDDQEARLREDLRGTDVGISRNGNQLILNMPGNITFPTDRSDISPDFYPVLDSVARALVEFDRTLVDVAGHTDSTGTLAHNLNLSVARATSVADYLSSRGVSQMRLYVDGYGPQYPIASNETPQGRAQNRRVEISLQPLTN